MLERNYWSHPAVYETFEDAQLVPIIKFPKDVRIRFYNGSICVYKPPATWAGIYRLLWEFPDLRFKSFEFEKHEIKDAPMVRGSQAFYVPQGWSPGKDVSYAMRRGVKEGLNSTESRDGAHDLIVKWAAWAKTRTVYISHIHYIRMALSDRFKTRVWRLHSEIVAVTSYFTDGNNANITVLKHLPVANWISRAIWGNVISSLQAEGYNVFCGETANNIKRSMGLASYPLYRIDVNKMKSLRPINFQPTLKFEGPMTTRKSFEFIRENAGVFQ